MGKQKSLRSKAVHFVSDLTTVFLNPISDKPSENNHSSPPPPPHSVDEDNNSKRSQLEPVDEEGTEHSVDGPDTSSFTAFLYSFLESSESGNDEQSDNSVEKAASTSNNAVKDTTSKKGLLSRGKHSLKAIYHATRIGGTRSQDRKSDSNVKVLNDDDGLEMNHMHVVDGPTEDVCPGDLPDISEPSMILSDKARSMLYASLPALVQGRKWLLLYSTWRHGISLSTLYRRSMVWPGPSLLVITDKKGAVFGGLVDAPLKPSNKKKYQGTNSTFVFTNTPGYPVIFRPTGANRYFTLCSTDFLAIGGGGHFALYLDGDLLNGSSSVSETYGNPCLALSENFEVKEVELWGFVYGSKYEEILASSRTEAPGICRW